MTYFAAISQHTVYSELTIHNHCITTDD